MNYVSRHTVVCHAAQEVSVPHREYCVYWQEDKEHDFHTYVAQRSCTEIQQN